MSPRKNDLVGLADAEWQRFKGEISSLEYQVVARHIAGMTNPEIADQIGKTTHQVGDALGRARHKLALLRRYGYKREPNRQVQLPRVRTRRPRE